MIMMPNPNDKCACGSGKANKDSCCKTASRIFALRDRGNIGGDGD
jgi:hypothetical protein